MEGSSQYMKPMGHSPLELLLSNVDTIFVILEPAVVVKAVPFKAAHNMNASRVLHVKLARRINNRNVLVQHHLDQLPPHHFRDSAVLSSSELDRPVSIVSHLLR